MSSAGKVVRLRRVVFTEPVEPPGAHKGVIEGRCDVLQRFPKSPGREAKSTPYDLELDPGRPGWLLVRHPTSGDERLVPVARILSSTPFDAEDHRRADAELERATAPAPGPGVAKAATAS